MDYTDLYVSDENKTMEEICNPTSGAFNYQKQQLFVKRWMSEGNSKLMLFHGLGSGKTCSSILAIEALQSQVSRVYVVTPASLKENFKKELKSECGVNLIGSNNDTFIHITSHQTFAKLKPNLENCLVIIDEVQNIVSSTGSTYKIYFDMLVTQGYKNMRTVLLSATPMFDKPHEIALTLNLLNIPKPLPVKKFYSEYLNKTNVKNSDDFIDRVSGYVSAFKGISPKAYAKRVDKTYLCKMSQHQYESYIQSVEGMSMNEMNEINFSQSFLSGPRMASNIVYKNGGFGSKYRPSDKEIKKQFKTNLKKYSTKFHRCITTLDKLKGPAFVYSNFVESGGINDFSIALKLNGYSKLNALKRKPSSVKKRFGVFRTGKDKENSALVALFNSPENKDGSLIKIIVGSPAMKEGISLKNTRSVHLIEPYWNQSRTDQIIGRAIRFCSHSSLPPKQRKVNVIHYISSPGGQSRGPKRSKTIDQHIMNMSYEKGKIIRQFETLLYRAAVDCHLFHKPNGLNKADCAESINQGFNANLIEKPTTFAITFTGLVENKEQMKEERLKKLLELSLIRNGKTYGFNVVVKAPNKVLMKFRDTSLNSMIHNQSWVESNNFTAHLILKKINKTTTNNNNSNNNKRPHRVLKCVKKNVKTKYTVAGGGDKRVKINSKYKGCPKNRRPDEEDKCPNSYPYKRELNSKVCCYKTPMYTKGIIKTQNGRLYVNGKLATSLTYDQLTKAARDYGKQLLPNMKFKKHIIELLKS